jgi:ammonium transporter, Amt family
MARRRTHIGSRAALLAGAALLAAPALASADSLEAYNNGALPNSVAINTIWVVVAGLLVMFMQAGFAFWRSASRAARTRARSSRRSS